MRRKKNPHLSGSKDFVGIYDKATIRKAQRALTVGGIRGIKVTAFKDDKTTYYELYVAKRRYNLNAIRLFIKLMQEAK